MSHFPCSLHQNLHCQSRYRCDVNLETDSKGWNPYNEWDAGLVKYVKVGMSVNGCAAYVGCRTVRSWP